MSEHINHAAEAERNAALATNAKLSTETVTALAALAQAHAMLAVAEQLRIRNLIDLGVIGGGPISNSSPTHAVQYLSSEYPDESKALGL